MTPVTIIKASLNDIEQLQLIARKTFYDTFASVNSVENMTTYLEEEFSISTLSTQLTNPFSEFYFALQNNAIIGYLKLNVGSSQIEIKQNKSIEIERIYVLQEFFGKGVGQQLLEKAIKIAQLKNAHYLWLGVWEENPRAIQFYKKNGFVAFDKHIFTLGNDKQTDILMKLNL